MTINHKNLLLVLVLSLAILLGACGPAASNSSIIATSVAATVAAQNTAQAALTPTPPVAVPTLPAVTTPTDAATNPPPTAPTGSGSNLCTASATYAGETIPDGTIMSPGQVFTKIWHITNSGTCPWNNSWKLVYSSGDIMGGAYVYNFPGVAMPGDTVNVPVVLTAPTTNGTYTGYWKIQSPWGYVFGDVSGNSYSVSIVVGSGTPSNPKTATVFDITAVSYDVSRRCTSANTFWIVTGHVSSNGPVTMIFTWVQSDGNNHRNIKVTFDSATTLDVTSPTWSQGIASSTNPRWMQIIETSPTYKEWPKSPPLILCGH